MWYKITLKMVEVTSEERDLPLNLKACQRLHHDLLQADEEAFEEIIPQGEMQTPTIQNEE